VRKEEAYRVSGDLKEQIVPVGDVGAPGKEYSAACKVAMILQTAKYIASLALVFSTVSFSNVVFAQRPSSNQVVLAPKIQRELGRALEALRNAKPEQALKSSRSGLSCGTQSSSCELSLWRLLPENNGSSRGYLALDKDH